MNQQAMDMEAKGQAAIMEVSKIVNRQTKLCSLSRKVLLLILFDYIKKTLINMIPNTIAHLFEIPILVLMRKIRVNKKLAQYIYRMLNYLLFEIKSVCFYIICVVLTLVSPQKYLEKILIMVFQDTLDIFKKF